MRGEKCFFLLGEIGLQRLGPKGENPLSFGKSGDERLLFSVKSGDERLLFSVESGDERFLYSVEGGENRFLLENGSFLLRGEFALQLADGIGTALFQREKLAVQATHLAAPLRQERFPLGHFSRLRERGALGDFKPGLEPGDLFNGDDQLVLHSAGWVLDQFRLERLNEGQLFLVLGPDIVKFVVGVNEVLLEVANARLKFSRGDCLSGFCRSSSGHGRGHGADDRSRFRDLAKLTIGRLLSVEGCLELFDFSL